MSDGAKEKLMHDINFAAHAAGTNAFVRDVLQRAHRAIRATPPAAAQSIDDVPSCGQENDYRRAQGAGGDHSSS